MESEEQRVIKTKYFLTRLELLLNYVKCLQMIKFLFDTYPPSMLLIKPQITKPRKCGIIIRCSSLKPSPKEVTGRRRRSWEYSLWLAKSKSPTHLPHSLAAEDTGVNGFLSLYLATSQQPSVPLSSQFIPEWRILELRH